MAWEWVAPVVAGASGTVGVFFTWFAGAQGRAHTERMVAKARDEELRVWRLKERRDAYLNALKIIDLDLRRQRYKRHGKDQKLAEVEKFWPKGQRVQMSIEAAIGVQVFGSPETRKLAEAWRVVAESDDYEAQIKLAEEIRQQVREELWPEATDTEPPQFRSVAVSKAHGKTGKASLRNGSPTNQGTEGTTRAHDTQKQQTLKSETF